jgi:hypothetical protein
MDNLHAILGAQYTVGGSDSILALQILVQTRSNANWTCDAEDGPGGTFLPETCRDIESCSAGDFRAEVDFLRIYEEKLVGDPVSSYV